MKNKLILFIIMVITFSKPGFSQTSTEPWNTKQLLAPAVLDSAIKSSSKHMPLIVCVGPSALIKGSVDAGATREKENLNKLKNILAKEKKNREVVIYCGCCPFDRCPNIRPAFQLLKKMKFTNARLLNIPKNLKTDWIDHGYAINE